ncbi:hypothetical protein M0R04_11635 [Candidatus Dojkabacteria bacterium]|jgi:hypothetical protein|nr:hypothetical protein [Candidatus Dojkabacteria bacterium]
MPGIDKLLALEICMVYNLDKEPLTPELKAAWALKDSRLIEAEMVELADKLDLLYIAHTRKFLRDPAITFRYNEYVDYFTSKKDKIRAYYPYIDRHLGGLLHDWDNNVSREVLYLKNLAERKAFKLHII